MKLIVLVLIIRRKDYSDGGVVHVARRVEANICAATRLLAYGRAAGGRNSQLRLRHPRSDQHVGRSLAQTADQPDERAEEHARGREEALQEARAHSGRLSTHSSLSSSLDAGEYSSEMVVTEELTLTRRLLQY